MRTAKVHHIGRSTVYSIVEELERYGFARRPRLPLSETTLTRLQANHLSSVRMLSQNLSPLAIRDPVRNLRGGLGPEQALLPNPEPQAHLALPEELEWHLKDTDTLRTLQEFDTAVQAYDVRCLALWLRWRDVLERAASLLVVAVVQDMPEPPVLTHILVDAMYELGFAHVPGDHLGPFRSSDNELRYSGGLTVAVLEQERHDAIEEAISDAVRSLGAESWPIGQELQRTYRELREVERMAQEVLKSTSETKEIEEGICPICVFPEAEEVARLSESQQPRRRTRGGSR